MDAMEGILEMIVMTMMFRRIMVKAAMVKVDMVRTTVTKMKMMTLMVETTLDRVLAVLSSSSCRTSSSTRAFLCST